MQAGFTPGGTEVGSIPAASTGLFFTNVPVGQYFVRVRAVNAAGTGAPTSDLVLNVGCDPPAAPTTLNFVVNGSVVGVNWNVEPGTLRTVLEVGYAPSATTISYTFTAPTAGLSTTAPPNTYFVRARAVSACGLSAPSVERTIVVP